MRAEMKGTTGSGVLPSFFFPLYSLSFLLSGFSLRSGTPRSFLAKDKDKLMLRRLA
jgi:hypothetical protein